MRIALAGNPNSGKTTMYNVLTGQSEKVGNWAGVTVDKKEHPIKRALTGGSEVIAVDLPGAYSMSAYTSEESITSAYIQNEHPDVIINIVDATNLARSLFFTTQLLELGIPMVVALNKSDVNVKRETVINREALEERLGCPVVDTVSTAAKGIEALVFRAMSIVGTKQTAPYSASANVPDTVESARRADTARYAFVNSIVKEVESRKILTREKSTADKIDALLTNRWLGIPIFALVMFTVFWLSQAGPGVWLADIFAGWLEEGQEALRVLIQGDEPALNIWGSMLIDGIIGGVIAVVGFLPLVMVMYFLIALLEDCGYMARATVVLDPIFKKVGLSGRSVIPFIIGTGCAVPGVMACRTIRDERERRATAMLAPFMPCGAKLPVIALFAGAFFGDSPWVGATMYFVGILIILLTSLLVNLLTGNRKKKVYFIIELPDYKLPSIVRAFFSTCQRGWSYIVKAGTVILVCNFVVHLMQNFTWSFAPVAEGAADSSILATVALPFAYIFAPVVGYVSWQLAAATITGFIAKENVVGTLAVCFGITNLIGGDELVLESGESVAQIAAAFGIGSGGSMLAASALAFLALNLFSPPCFAAIGAMNSEMRSKKWLFAGIGLQISVGYTVGFLINFFGTLISGEKFVNPWTVIVGWIVVLAISAVFAYLIIKRKREDRIKASLSESKVGEPV